MEIKELESILKAEFNEEALEKALHVDAGNNAESAILDNLKQREAKGEGAGGNDEVFPMTDQSNLMSEDDSLMQMVNEKAAMEDVGTALEDFAEENKINRGKFINQQLKPFPNSVELPDSEVQLISLMTFMLSLTE